MSQATKPPADQPAVATNTTTTLEMTTPPTRLTLREGQMPVSFKTMTWTGMREVRYLTEFNRIEWLGQFPDLQAFQEANPTNQVGFRNHKDFPAYNAESELRIDYAPWLAAASANGQRLTLEDLLASTDGELMECMVAVAEANPTRAVEMPYLVAVEVERRRQEREKAGKAGGRRPNG